MLNGRLHKSIYLHVCNHLYWQLHFGSQLTIVSILGDAIALITI
jgi:hypothetical protein